MRKVFISYHHKNDQWYKNQLESWGTDNQVFINRSVEDYEIPDDWSDQRIRRYIRDKKLKDSTVTILLVGIETKFRKHIDWEIYSSMYNGEVNKQSGVIVITLPSTGSNYQAKTSTDPDRFENLQWGPIANKSYFKSSEPHLPDRIVDNLTSDDGVMVSVIPWDDVNDNPDVLIDLIDSVGQNKHKRSYDMSRPMRRANHNM